MKQINTINIVIPLVFFCLFASFSQVHSQEISLYKVEKLKKKKKQSKKKIKHPEIDLTNWSVTVPFQKSNGKPLVVEYPEILEYESIFDLSSYMYKDSRTGAIVFYAEPTQATTPNSKYSRSELREQMDPGNNNINWNFKQGGSMKGKLSVDRVSKDSSGKYHRVMIMQIHGRLSDEQRDLIGQKDNNAPPILKIYWDQGKVRVKTKVLKDLNSSYEDMLDKNAWEDDNGFNFDQEVSFRKFELEIRVTKGKIVVILNRNEYKVYKGIHIDKWGIFENYFKAGNYFQSRDEGSYAKVSYYSLEVAH